MRESHDPTLNLRMPGHLRIPELSTIDIDNRVARIGLEGIAAILTVGNILRLETRDCSDSVGRDHAVVLAWEEAARVVRVDYCGAAVYIRSAVERP